LDSTAIVRGARVDRFLKEAPNEGFLKGFPNKGLWRMGRSLVVKPI